MANHNKEIATIAYAQMARIGHALGDSTRLRILNFLMQNDRSVDELSTMIGHSAPNTSAHLKVLQNAQLVSRRKEGRFVYYRMANPMAIRLWIMLRDMGLETIPEAREAMTTVPDRDTVIRHFDPVSLLEEVRAGQLTIIDLRPSDEYAAGHVPEAKSIPFAELARRLDELDPSQRIVAYCRGPFCYGAIEGTALLKKNGFEARRMYGGVGDWIRDGQSLDGHDDEQRDAIASQG